MPPSREQRIASVMARRQPDLQLIVENVDDPHNVGAILRSCDAVGVGAVHLVYAKDKMPRMQELRSKSAASAVKWLNIHKWTSLDECLASFGDTFLPLYIATLADTGRAPWDLDLASPCIIAVGNEHDGPSAELVSRADGIITIPMQGFVESFNVSVATAICLVEAMRQRYVVRERRTRE
jgi:tRNA (guanosine-2'-O-)-methyltransferase